MICLFIYGLFNDAASNTDYMISYNIQWEYDMNNEPTMTQKEANFAEFEPHSGNLTEGLRKITKFQSRRCRDLDLNWIKLWSIVA
jgi:hypothetical protein